MYKVTENVSIENARIIFRNFSGRKTKYNREGNRNFNVVIPDQDMAERLKADGWNVKRRDPMEDGDPPQYRMEVTVNFGGRPPKIVMVTKKAQTVLTEETVNALDYAEIANVDLVISPYNWFLDGQSGVKAYLKTMYVTIEEDEFADKYADYPRED